jgi:hypothetical protein
MYQNQYSGNQLNQCRQTAQQLIQQTQQSSNQYKQMLQHEVSGQMPSSMMNSNVSSFPQSQQHTPFQQHSYQQ